MRATLEFVAVIAGSLAVSSTAILAVRRGINARFAALMAVLGWLGVAWLVGVI